MDQVKREEVAMVESKKGDEVMELAEAEEKDGRVRWERFLPQASIRVLLVEADDSTGEILAALLRKCGYSVTAISDGLEAWETLKEKGKEIDLVLTEVELPSLPGFDLLTMITEHEICKNIPVIMMSSYDNMSMVFKCMLKGVADYLVKPIRKNELRNLWQHVWRRYSSKSDYGAQNRSQDVNVSQQKSQASSENDAASNNSGGFSVCVEKNRECREKGSDTQSSCTRTVKDAERTSFENGYELNEMQLKSTSAENDMRFHGGIECNSLKEISLMHDDENLGCSSTSEIDRKSTWLTKTSLEIADLLGTMDTSRCTCSLGDNNSNDSKISSNVEDPLFNLNSTPELELTLRSQEHSNRAASGNNGRNILNHSSSSPFSRYSSKTILFNHPELANVRVESKYWLPPVDKCSLDHSCGLQLKETTLNLNGDDTRSTVITSSNQDKKAVKLQHSGIAPYAVHANACNGGRASFGSSLEPMIPKELGAPPWIIGSPIRRGMPANFSDQLGLEVVSSEQSQQSNNQTAKKQTLSGKKEMMQALESDGDLKKNSSVGDNGSGSICNSNRSHLDSVSRSTCSGVNENLAVESANSIPTGSSCDAFHTFDDTNLIHMQRSIQREAALAKFRLKRKERCYEKKVRYQSRKKLAEQRPRIKGQFVRQVQPCPQTPESDGFLLSQ